MKLLLDTHTFLWFMDDSPLRSARGKALLEADNDLLLSLGSLAWLAPLRGSMPLRTETLVVSSCREAVGAFDHMELCDTICACRWSLSLS
jgi:hypothetical protein